MYIKLRKDVFLRMVLVLMMGAGCVHRVPVQERLEIEGLHEAPQESELYYLIIEQERLSRAGDTLSSIKALERALKLDPDSNYIIGRLAEEYLKTNDLEKAEKLAKKGVEQCDTCRISYTVLGQIYQRRMAYEKAEIAFLKSLSLDKDDSGEDVLFLTTIYTNTKQFAKAIKILKQFISRNPDSELAHYYLGRVYSETNQLDQAIEAYNHIIELNPDFPHSYKALGLIYEFQNNLAKALEYYQKASVLEPDNIELAKHLAVLCIDLKRYDDAKDRLKQLIQLQPEDSELKIRLGLLYLREERIDLAKSLFHSTLKSDPESDQVKYYLGIIHERNKSYSQALKFLKGIKAQSRYYSDARQIVAIIYENQGNHKGAKLTLSNALSKTPEDLQLNIHMAKLLAKEKRLEDAIILLETKRKANAKSENLLFALGELYDQANNFKKLEASFKELIAINPNHSHALNYLGFSYAKEGINLDEAEKLVLKAIHLKPNDGYIVDSLGWVYYKKGLYSEAESTLKKATELAPNEPVILEHLGDTLIKLGKLEEAKQVYEEALKNSTEDVEKRRIVSKLQKFVSYRSDGTCFCVS
ncbi:MAG: tetratricopeptide repeat protein [Bdellovibrionales bacterium]|nr:tetratricopeptide repeat protein [Bdellovibrionales bacterium]